MVVNNPLNFTKEVLIEHTYFFIINYKISIIIVKLLYKMVWLNFSEKLQNIGCLVAQSVSLKSLCGRQAIAGLM